MADDLATSLTGPTIDSESQLTYLGEDWRRYVVLALMAVTLACKVLPK